TGEPVSPRRCDSWDFAPQAPRHLLSVLVTRGSGCYTFGQVIKHAADRAAACLRACVAVLSEVGLAFIARTPLDLHASIDLLRAQRRQFFLPRRFTLLVEVGVTLELRIALRECERQPERRNNEHKQSHVRSTRADGTKFRALTVAGPTYPSDIRRL